MSEWTNDRVEAPGLTENILTAIPPMPGHTLRAAVLVAYFSTPDDDVTERILLTPGDLEGHARRVLLGCAANDIVEMIVDTGR